MYVASAYKSQNIAIFRHFPLYRTSKKKKSLTSLFVNVAVIKGRFTSNQRSLKVTASGSRGLLADKSPCLSANATKADVMSYLICSKTISDLFYAFNRSIWSSCSVQLNHSRSKPIRTFSKQWNCRKFIRQNKIVHESRFIQINNHGSRIIKTRTTTWNLPGPSETRDCINIVRWMVHSRKFVSRNIRS